MSEEQLKAFLEAVKADAGLQDKLKAAADADAVVAIAKSAGFAIIADDLSAKADGVEISEEELDATVGGGGLTIGECFQTSGLQSCNPACLIAWTGNYCGVNP
jgi:predicted ribosomally synthesized peptide with nif11-like leader